MTEVKASLGPRFAAVAGDCEMALERLGLAPGAAVLDAGTGSGNCAIALAAAGFAVTTGEPAEDRSMYARRDWESAAEQVGVREQIRFVPFDASELPFSDGEFEAVFFFGVLHHIPEQRRPIALREAMRVARKAVAFLEPGAAMLAKVREDDPAHPEAADPTLYGEWPVERFGGAWMEGYLYMK